MIATSVHQAAFILHVIAGSLALIVFWLPIFAKKGSPNHIRFGRYFTYGMYAVAFSGLIMTSLVLVDPIGVRAPERNLSLEAASQLALNHRLFAGFLMMLSFLVLNVTRHSVLVLRVKGDRGQLKRPLSFLLLGLLAVSCITMGIVGYFYDKILFLIFAGLSVSIIVGQLRYIFKRELKPREWIVEHLGSIFGAGIAAYTAFFVFGGSRIFQLFINDSLHIIFWVAPGVIGTFATSYFTKKYRAKYRVA